MKDLQETVNDIKNTVNTLENPQVNLDQPQNVSNGNNQNNLQQDSKDAPEWCVIV